MRKRGTQDFENKSIYSAFFGITKSGDATPSTLPQDLLHLHDKNWRKPQTVS